MDASGCLAVGALQVALDQQVPGAMAQLLLDYERRSMEAEDRKAIVRLQGTAESALNALYMSAPYVARRVLEMGGVQAEYAHPPEWHTAGTAAEWHTAGTATEEDDVNMEDEDAATDA